MPKWLMVARNEYRIRTSRIRKIRPYLPYLVVGLLSAYVVFIAPAFVSLFIDDFLAFFLSQVAVAMMQVILFIVFLYFIMIPISDTLREEQTGQLEIFLAAPIEPSDVLLGEFLGEMPFYAIFITVVTGLFTALLTPLKLDVAQIGIVIMIFVATSLSALWIGTVIAAILRTKLGKTARGRDVGRALAMIIALPFVALVYTVQFGGLSAALSNPETANIVAAVLSLLPSSWGAEVIVGFAANPGNIAAVGFETATRLCGLFAFFVAVLWLGTQAASRAYSLEPTTFISSRARPDGAFYKTVRFLGGSGAFGTLVVSIFKDYGRRLENLSNMTYIMGLLIMMNIFISPTASSGPDDPPASLIMALFMFPILAVMASGGVTIQGKEHLFIYKKAPSGVGRLVRARLVQGWLVVVPIAGAITAGIVALIPQNTLAFLLISTGLMMLSVAANVAFTLGLFLLNPAFSAKSVKLFLNVMIVVFVSIGQFAASILFLMKTGMSSGPMAGIMYVLLLQTLMSWIVGIIFLYLGKAKLTRIE